MCFPVIIDQIIPAGESSTSFLNNELERAYKLIFKEFLLS